MEGVVGGTLQAILQGDIIPSKKRPLVQVIALRRSRNSLNKFR